MKNLNFFRFAAFVYILTACCQAQQPTPQSVSSPSGSVTILDNTLMALLLTQTADLRFESATAEEFIDAIEMYAPGGGIDTVNGWITVKLRNRSSGLPVFSFNKSGVSILELLVAYCHVTRARCIIANGCLTIN